MKTIKTLTVIGILSLGLLNSVHSVGATTATIQVTRHIDMVYVIPMRVTTAKTIADYSADSGNRYVTIWVKAINKNDVQKTIRNDDFTLYSQNGVEYRYSPYAEISPELVPESERILDVNGHIYGSIGFEIPANLHHFYLRWSPSPDNSNERWPTATWAVNV